MKVTFEMGIIHQILKDEAFMESEVCQSLLVQIFDKINVEQWSQLLNAFDVAIFPPIFQKAAALDKIAFIKHITGILDALQKMDAQKTNPFLMESLGHIPTYLSTHALDKDDNTKHALTIVDNLLRLSALKNEDETWLEATVECLVKSMSRKYVNEVLVPTLLASERNKEGNLAKRLFKVCQQDLVKRTTTKPTPPATWTREVPKGTYNTRYWDMLKPFLESPTLRVFDYARVQGARNAMESAISLSRIHLIKRIKYLNYV